MINTPLSDYSSTANEDTHFSTQLRITKEAFFKKPSTMREVEVLTKVLRPHICRFVSLMRENGTIQAIKKGRCSITRRIVGIYSTNPALFLPNPQMSLFNAGGNNE